MNTNKKNAGGKVKLELSRETIRTLRVKTEVRTGGGLTVVGCVVVHSKITVGECQITDV
jgi:hypothetical protein